MRQDPITHVAGDKPVIAGDHLAADGSIPVEQAAKFLGVELLTERRRTHQIAEHHGELATSQQGCRSSLVGMEEVARDYQPGQLRGATR